MSKKISTLSTIITQLKRSITAMTVQLSSSRTNYLARRPHRTLRLTRRRDYTRSLTLPGYWAFTNEVRAILWQYRKTFCLLALTYATVTAALVGIASQDTYATLTDALSETGGEIFAGNLGALGEAGLLFVTATSGGLAATPTEAQQIYAALIGTLTWLTAVWLLRSIMAGSSVKLRDGLYNASAPLMSTALVGLVLIVQLLPLALALIGYSAAVSTGLLAGGVEAMLFWLAAGALGLLSLYWISSTCIALVVVTLPGMYPLRAIKTAGDLVVGRRMRILLRLLWMALVVIATWALIVIPIILFDIWIKSVAPGLAAVPIIPVSLLLMSSLTIVWAASYVYLLYRKVVADDAKPA